MCDFQMMNWRMLLVLDQSDQEGATGQTGVCCTVSPTV